MHVLTVMSNLFFYSSLLCLKDTDTIRMASLWKSASSVLLVYNFMQNVVIVYPESLFHQGHIFVLLFLLVTDLKHAVFLKHSAFFWALSVQKLFSTRDRAPNRCLRPVCSTPVSTFLFQQWMSHPGERSHTKGSWPLKVHYKSPFSLVWSSFTAHFVHQIQLQHFLALRGNLLKKKPTQTRQRLPFQVRSPLVASKVHKLLLKIFLLELVSKSPTCDRTFLSRNEADCLFSLLLPSKIHPALAYLDLH